MKAHKRCHLGDGRGVALVCRVAKLQISQGDGCNFSKYIVFDGIPISMPTCVKDVGADCGGNDQATFKRVIDGSAMVPEFCVDPSGGE